MKLRFFVGVVVELQVKDRVAWREALVQKTYDRQCETLCWRSKADCKVILNGIYVDRYSNIWRNFCHYCFARSMPLYCKLINKQGERKLGFT